MGHLYTVADIVGMAGVSTRTVYRWIEAGDLAAYKLGGRTAGWRIDSRDWEDFLEVRRAAAGVDTAT